MVNHIPQVLLYEGMILHFKSPIQHIKKQKADQNDRLSAFFNI